MPEDRPAQHQDRQPGLTQPMQPRPRDHMEHYHGSGKLAGKVALITGGDSGIGRATSIAFAKEGADLAIVYLNEDADAQETRRLVEAEGRRCLLIAGDVGDEEVCRQAVAKTIEQLGRLDVLVNNAGEQHPVDSLEDIDREQLERTFRTNIFGMFFLCKAALPYLKQGAAIVNTTSVTAYRGQPKLLDYSATKGAIVSFTRSLAASLAESGIRVNGVAPGPTWTPLIASTYQADQIPEFGSHQPLGRAGEPDDVAPSFVFLASDDAAFMTGQVLHPNGGEPIAG